VIGEKIKIHCVYAWNSSRHSKKIKIHCMYAWHAISFASAALLVSVRFMCIIVVGFRLVHDLVNDNERVKMLMYGC
jgi:hypothetical protein